MTSPFAAFIGIRRINCYVISFLFFKYTSHFIWEETNISNNTSFSALSVFMFTNACMILLLFV